MKAVAGAFAARFNVEPSLFSAAKFQSALKTSVLGRYLHYRGEVSSTMDVLDALARDGAPTGTLVLAEYQSKGKGRGEKRSWAASHGQNLTFSLLLRTSSIEEVLKTNFAVPVSVAMALRQEGISKAGCKWPNDVWIDGKKVCGILVNSSSLGVDSFIVNAGIGINVNEDMSAHPDKDVRATATSVSAALGNKPVSREQLLASILGILEYQLSRPLHEVLFQYESLDVLIGKRITVFPKKREDPTGSYTAKAVGLSDTGALRVIRESDGQEITLISEEVSTRPIEEEQGQPATVDVAKQQQQQQ